ncbi:MAG: hypothetical protein V8S58_00195 [Lachnospiraceae bacterium]
MRIHDLADAQGLMTLVVDWRQGHEKFGRVADAGVAMIAVQNF